MLKSIDSSLPKLYDFLVMIEDETPAAETSESLTNQLIELVEETEFGKPSYQAISDYFDLSELRDKRGVNLINLEAENHPKRKREESQLRIHEARIALLEHQIDQNKSQLPGYARSFSRIDVRFKDLQTLSGIEADGKSKDPHERRYYVAEKLGVAKARVQDIIARKRDTS